MEKYYLDNIVSHGLTSLRVKLGFFYFFKGGWEMRKSVVIILLLCSGTMLVISFYLLMTLGMVAVISGAGLLIGAGGLFISLLRRTESLHKVVVSEPSKLVEWKEVEHSEQLFVIGELAAGIAHEIRNPLTTVKGFLELSKYNKQDMDHYLELMISEMDRINLIVNELLLLSKPKQLQFSRIEITPLVKTVVTLLKTQAILQNVELHFDSGTDCEGIYVKGDSNKLKQVFINLIQNSLEAMDQNGHITISLEKEEKYVSIKVKDQGTGIPQEILDKIGKRFYSTKEKGTGLGLMICTNIVGNHNGSLSIESQYKKGTEVKVTLPLC